MPTEVRTVSTPDGTRSYRLYVPIQVAVAAQIGPLVAPQRPRALIVLLHGGGGSATQMQTDLRFDSQIAESKGVAVAYPDGVSNSWNDGRAEVTSTADDVAYLGAVMTDATTRLGMPARRVCLAGISNGGHMTLRFACEQPKRCKAYGVVAASMSEALAARFPNPPNVPLILLHGTADPLTPYDGGVITLPWESGATRGGTLGAPRTFQRFSDRGKCPGAATQVKQQFPVLNDGTAVTVYTRPACQAIEVPVALYAIQGGGHTWPGVVMGGYVYNALVGPTSMNLNGNRALWQFFQGHL